MSLSRVDGSLAPSFLDDAERAFGKNGLPAIAALMARIIRLCNQAANQGHPFLSFVCRDDLTTSPVMRQVYSPRNIGATLPSIEAGVALWEVPQNTDGVVPGPGFQTGQGISLNFAGTDHLTEFDFGEYGHVDYPSDVRVTEMLSGYGHNSALTELKVLGQTTNYPMIRAMSLWQTGTDFADPTSTGAVIGSADVRQTGDIVGESSGSNEALDSWTRVFNDTFTYSRPQIGWSGLNADSAPINFTTSKNQFRYIFDQGFGTGGTSFAANKPAITLPLSFAAAGRRTQVRVYVFVYAWMSGTTNTGSIGVANKDNGGTMASSATALTNGPTISGTTPAWYPGTGSFDPATSPYFLGYAGSAPDRVALCAKSSGTTDSVKIGAWTMIVQHSVA